MISVVIPAKNSKNTISLCINSILAQSVKAEVIVVDNGSSDGTPNLVRKFPTVELIIETKRGSYAARNAGIRSSRGDIIVFIDSDCIAQAGWLEALHDSLKGNILLAGGPIYPEKTKSQLSKYCGRYCHPQEIHYKSGYLAASNMAVRRRAFVQYGYFKEVMSGGDFEFSSRFKREKIGFASSAIVRHNYDESLLKLSRRFFRYGKGSQSLDGYHYPSLREILKNEPQFLHFRMIQDISFTLGRVSKIVF